MVRIGLTGIFGSGKSTVCKFFREKGIPVISCDFIVSHLLRTKRIRKKIEEEFGKDYFFEDGKLNKRKLAELIFSSADARKRLNSIIHPEVFKKLEEKLDTYKRNSKIAVVVEIPLLFETRSENLFDVIVTVSAPYKVIKKRLEKKYSHQEIEKRIKSQMPLKKKEMLSDFIIENSGSLKDTKKQINKIIEDITRRYL
ncbi:MAG TPA: dephospho-CoA kinase [Candidatus Ratteibacteria bacterium]|uniref:Dephospho-CoA kinase n=1 Tax=candidate division TA06 bacterium ADurb.Bin131 TaxID=1852827 RepID=A0A1V6CDJ0_UNCT6|nr:MAG: Dephospho-CoA kinase [candidate division TA06 bacterium ADurb.Bin131]HON04957.1 dephospho-CoA kinase [bacterium]HPC28719.1 dephospho-CoA kinase [bacterium]HRS06035.1 dephospho-CoA kinase [Candidatus Ratteibacteria bacterium]HRV03514.1 dephospho-CoA kinase [Candidatus Ratteibacteria bacterium]